MAETNHEFPDPVPCSSYSNLQIFPAPTGIFTDLRLKDMTRDMIDAWPLGRGHDQVLWSHDSRTHKGAQFSEHQRNIDFADDFVGLLILNQEKDIPAGKSSSCTSMWALIVTVDDPIKMNWHVLRQRLSQINDTKTLILSRTHFSDGEALNHNSWQQSTENVFEDHSELSLMYDVFCYPVNAVRTCDLTWVRSSLTEH